MTPAARPLDLATFPLRGRQLIEASAGTGKTYTLAALYVRLVLGHGDAQSGFGRPLMPPEIVVMTFTNAATQELRDRIRTRLAEAAALFAVTENDAEVGLPADDFLLALRAEYPPADWPLCARRLALAAEWMDEAAVYTIHGWCNRVLGDHAFASGHLFDQELASDQSELLQEAVRDYWRAEIVPLPDKLSEAVAKNWATPEALGEELVRLLGERELLAPSGSLAEVFANMQAALAPRKAPMAAWADELEALFDAAHAKNKLRGNRMRPDWYKGWLQAVREWAADPFAARPELSEAATTTLTPGGLQQAWKGMPQDAELRNLQKHPALRALEDLAKAPATDDFLRERLLRHATHAVAARLAAMQQQRAEIGFDDLLDRLDAALQGPHGALLAATLRVRYPVALVDEFQDTDPVQYRIFDAVYAQAHAADTALVLIGDPKQAIYGFRGADFNTYLAARSSCQARHTLATNYRSTRAMVAAVNACFEWGEQHANAGAFGLRRDGHDPLPYERAVARGRAEALEVNGAPVAALTLAELPAATSDKALGKGAYIDAAAAHAAAHIVTLLAAGREGRAVFRAEEGGRRALSPGDIAVLVNTRREAAAVRDALSQRGVRSVYLSERDSVFQTSQAAEVEFWLAACARPDDVRAVRAALATPLLALDWAALARLESDEFELEARVQQFRLYRELWHRHGVLAAVQRLLHDFAVPARLLSPEGARKGGERMLTDVLHLAELLQQAAGELDGEAALLRHLANLRQGDVRHDAHTRRLESDADLVQVVTVHKSKGLEYPLVFLPFACAASNVGEYRKQAPRNAPAALRVHDDEGNAELRFERDADTLARRQREQLSEDLRKLYVALTRARHACWLSVAAVDSGVPGSAWNYLLAGDTAAVGKVYGKRLKALARSSSDIVHVELPALAASTRLPPSAADSARGPARIALPRVAPAWWVTSHSALKTTSASGLDEGKSAADSAREDTFREDREPVAAPALAAVAVAGDQPVRRPAADTIHAFPRGDEAGTLLHDLLQWACDTGFAEALADPARLRDIVARYCARRGWERWIEVVHAWLQAFIAAPWPLPDATPLALVALSPARAVAEMEFWFAIHQADTVRLDALVSAHVFPGQPRPPLAPQSLNGMLKGFIDLVFEHGGRYYVADYKSNTLGVTDSDYTAAAMQLEMAARRYDLQLALYLLALHRHLRARLPDYDYDRHVGGAVYWFMRGAASHIERPPRALIEAMDGAVSAP